MIPFGVLFPQGPADNTCLRHDPRLSRNASQIRTWGISGSSSFSEYHIREQSLSGFNSVWDVPPKQSFAKSFSPADGKARLTRTHLDRRTCLIRPTLVHKQRCTDGHFVIGRTAQHAQTTDTWEALPRSSTCMHTKQTHTQEEVITEQ